MIDEKQNNIDALIDTVKQTHNKLGQAVATITQFRTQSIQNFLALKSLDSTVRELQSIVKNNQARIKGGGSATVFTSTTSIDTSGKTHVSLSKKDSLALAVLKAMNDSSKVKTIAIFPVYTSIIDWGKWGTFKTIANKDSTRLIGGFNNEYSLVLGEDNKPGLFHPFRKAIPFAEVTNYNPHTITNTLRSYQVSPLPPKTWAISITGGYGIFPSSGAIRSGPGVIIGLSKSLIRW